MAGETWLTVAEVAARLKLNPETVRRWLRTGKLHGRLFGGSGGYRIAASELQRWMEAAPPVAPRRGRPAKRKEDA